MCITFSTSCDVVFTKTVNTVMKIKDIIQEHSTEHSNDRMVQKHLDFFGMPVCIEIVKGGVKYSTTREGKPWQKTMKCDYGYFDGITGNDGEFLDCFIGPAFDEPSCDVFVVKQMSPDGKKFDEHKIMIGFSEISEAKQMYLQHCHTPNCFGSIKSMPLDKFKSIIHSVFNQ